LRVEGPLRWSEGWRSRILGGLLGLAVGDALGLPVEFSSPEELREKPVRDMVGGGWWGKPAGTWSDDTALALATADALASSGLSLEGVARAFLAWYLEGEYTPDGDVFDVGNTTRSALQALARGAPPDASGVESASCGSLMRIFPASAYTLCLPIGEALRWVHAISRITHSHPLAEMACGLYTAVVRGIFAGMDKWGAVEEARGLLEGYYSGSQRYRRYASRYSYFRDPRLLLEPPEEASCGAPEMLRASLWALLRGGGFRETVLLAVNLGGDTDTVGAVAGSLAGAYYGLESIPGTWLSRLRGSRLAMGIASRLVDAVRRACQ
jgi:ADP-ribosyl-[dinitrogen reductase] hydrolase